MEETTPNLRITLYLPDGDTETYVECRLGSSLVPELEFWGKRAVYIQYGIRGAYLQSAEEHITSTTLPYTIKNLDHTSPDVVK